MPCLHLRQFHTSLENMSESKLMSQNSVEQDENLAKLFCKTPGTPTKIVHQTPRRSNRKRSLFQTNSPSNSDDLGLSPLSASSSNSFQSNCSPYFSPNGKFSTPCKTSNDDASLKEINENFYDRKIEVKSSLFPNLNVPTQKSQRKVSTPVRQSPRISSAKKNAESKAKAVAKDLLEDMATPTRSTTTHTITSDADEVETNSLVNPDSSEKINSTLGIKTISSESFYGPTPPMPKHRTQLFIDSLGSKMDSKKRTRSLSKESLISNKSFVCGATQNKRKKTSDTFNRAKNMKLNHQKGPHVGVWHGIKKPRKMKPVKKIKPSLLSPNTRISKIVNSFKNRPLQDRSKRFFDERSRRRLTLSRKKNYGLSARGEIIDSFPHHLVKRKLLPSVGHPSSETTAYLDTPDPEKKFLKYGLGRKATFTLNENVKIQFSDGVMKLQSPKKRRKLYSGKNDMFFDLNDDDPKNTDDLNKNIENILVGLDDDKTAQKNDKENAAVSSKTVENISNNEILNILESPIEIANPNNENECNVLAGIQSGVENKFVTDLSTPVLKDLMQENDASIENLDRKVKLENDEEINERGPILIKCESIDESVFARNDFEETHLKKEIETYNTEDEEASQGKFYSLFYKQNWNTSSVSKEIGNKTSPKKKLMMVPDDQYLLDAGQKSIGIVTCGKCGVMYQAGDFADEATHKNFHNHLPELRFTYWTNERVVGKYLDGRIIMVVSSDPKPWWSKITKIVDIVDQELGFPEGAVNALYYKTVYLFINEKAKQIVGCLIAEQCHEAYKMFPPLEGVDVDSCSKDPSPCKIGISRIWTALNHRRRGVAKRMIECMQRTFIYGEIVPIDLVAFSVPSPSGKLLAQKVTGKLDFLVYGFA